MEYVYGALVLHAAGKEISEEAVGKVVKAAGVKPDETRIKALTASLEGVDLDEVLSAAVVAPAAAPAAPAAAEEKGEEEEKKKEKKEEVSEEEAAAGLGALFG